MQKSINREFFKLMLLNEQELEFFAYIFLGLLTEEKISNKAFNELLEDFRITEFVSKRCINRFVGNNPHLKRLRNNCKQWYSKAIAYGFVPTLDLIKNPPSITLRESLAILYDRIEEISYLPQRDPR